MAKHDNLKDFLTDVANAIRAKKGTMGPINPQNFSAEIAAIETGGGGSGGGSVSVLSGAVNFRDYDGTILHSYSKDEFLALTELPELPSQQGLICQGWNYSLEDAQSYVGEHGVLEIGANYITDDGKTRLYISVPKYRQNINLYFSQTVANGVTIDWGDGSDTGTVVGTGSRIGRHSYTTEGDYVITLEVADGCRLGFGDGSSSCILGSVSASDKPNPNALRRIEIGQGVTGISNVSFQNCYSLSLITIPQGVVSIGTYAFNACYSLCSVIIPQGVTTINSNTFQNCYSLSSVTIPQGVTTISNYAFQNCSSLFSVTIPQGVTTISAYAFQNCYSLSSVTIPQGVKISNYAFSYCYSLSSVIISQGVTTISAYAFQNCYSLCSVIISQGVTTISDYAFQNCYSLTSVIIPQSVTKINSNAFSTCTGMALYDFRALVSVPTLGGTNAFTSIRSDCKMVVPDALYDAWIAATNWSTYASNIVKASEYNG